MASSRGECSAMYVDKEDVKRACGGSTREQVLQGWKNIKFNFESERNSGCPELAKSREMISEKYFKERYESLPTTGGKRQNRSSKRKKRSSKRKN